MTHANDFLQEKAKIQYYQIITALLCEPEDDVTNNQEVYRRLREAVEILDETLLEWVDNLKEHANRPVKELLIEYSRLFIGPFKLPSPPYASCYLGSKEFNGEVSEWVRKYYENAGLAFDYTIMDLPDHIAVETEFLQYLLSKHLETNEVADIWDEKYLKAFNYFVANHHGKWVPQLADAVIEHTNEPYYKTLFELIKKMIPNL